MFQRSLHSRIWSFNAGVIDNCINRYVLSITSRFSEINICFVSYVTSTSLNQTLMIFMWQGHDLRLLRSQIVGMLATAKRTGTNIPNIPKGIRDPCCPQTHPPKWPRVQSANLSRCSKSTRLIGQTASGNMTPASQPIKGWREGVRARVYFHQTDRPVVLQPPYISSWRKFILLSLMFLIK